ncbi:MAG: Uma2 family endonuclease [Deltaproteobacteria bacterium]|nr:Uma2 family endonuclease [Deltaproteobacteria bacterium]
MVAPPPKRATYDDILNAPDNVVAEIVDGELHLSPRPANAHGSAATILGEELGPPFRRGRGGPGGWIFIDEPELHLDTDVLVPDLAGWRRGRAPEVREGAYLTVAPDWVCEVLSPSTRKFDRASKLPIYARVGVGHAWLLDPVDRTLEVLRLDHGHWLTLATYVDNAVVRAEPFDAIELDLGALWAP